MTAADVEARQGELADAEHDVEKDQENIAAIQDNVTEAKDALAEIKPRSLPGPYQALTRLIFTDFYRFFGLSWETSPQTDSTPEASKRPGSRRIEFSSKSTTFLMW